MAVVLESEAVREDELLTQLPSIRQQAIKNLPLVISEQGIEASGNNKFHGAVYDRDAAYCAIQALEGNKNGDLEKLISASKQTLLTTSRFQGHTFNKRSGETPWEMPHEIHGPTSNQERLRKLLESGWSVKQINGHLEMVNWKSLDGTPLWIIHFATYINATGDYALRDKLWTNFERALSWINLYGDKDGDLLIEGGPEYKNDMKNQCWRDSDDSLVNEEGKMPEQPIAPLDANCFNYRAQLEAANLYQQRGQYEKAQKCRERAGKIKEAVNTFYWMDEKDTFAPALDKNKNQIKIVTSDAAIALWSGVVDENKAQRVARRLLKPDLMTPYGLRSRSRDSARYDPTKYQRGNVWLHLAPVAAAGCDKYALLDEAYTFDQVLPNIAKLQFEELTIVDEDSNPHPYLEESEPAACYPMAWVIGGVLGRTYSRIYKSLN